jgi:signal transduction histidine kinase
MSAPRPFDEQARLEALQRYRVLDSTREEAFDDLVRLAALVCRTPISLVSLVDATRQWFKAKEGLDVPELPRETAFCAHAIMGVNLLVVPDTHADAIFATNPLVLGPPHIRFYAGAPLITPEGMGLGTLCVIDHVPRTIGPEEARALTALARHVMTQLELRRSLLEIDERNSELDTFSRSVAHDLRAPLRAIRGLSELIREENAGRILDARGQEWLGRIVQAADRMHALIDGVLSYARISRGNLPIETVELGSMVREVLNDLSAELESRRAVVEVAPDLPAVRASSVALRQALANLLSNAVKFVAPGVAPRVRVEAERRGDRAVVSIADNGIGIPAALQGRLFQPFSTLLGPGDPNSGVGIGLSIVKKAVDRMGGRLGLESEPGRGSRFWLELALPLSGA